MSDVPSEVQALHLRLFERYASILIDRLDIVYTHSTEDDFFVNTPDYEEVIALQSRIERILAFDGEQQINLKLSRRDFAGLMELRTIVGEFYGPGEEPPPEKLAAVLETPSVAEEGAGEAVMTCARCGGVLRVTLEPDEGWCINHGPQFIGTPMGKPEHERVPRLPAQHNMVRTGRSR